MNKKITLLFLILSILFASKLTFAQKAPKSNFRFTLNGVTGEVKDNITKRLEIYQSAYTIPLREADINAIYRQAPEEIREAMKPYGFFKVHINTELIQHNEEWIATYTILEGPIMPIANVKITIDGEGKDNKILQELIKNFPLKKNDRFLIAQYDSAKNKLLTAAEQDGFIYAKLLQDDIIINMNTYSAEIIFHLDTGKQHFFGDIRFHNEAYSDVFLQRFLNIKKGEVYSSDKLVNLQEAISRSGFFSSVAINPETDETKDHFIPITIASKPSSARRYRFGVGYGTYTEYRASIELIYRQLTDTGHYARIFMNQSGTQSGITAQYVIPGLRPITDKLIFAVEKKRKRPENGQSDYDNLSVKYLWKQKRWNFSLGTVYQQELSRAFDIDPLVRTHFLMPEINIGYDGADKPLSPTKGFSLNLNVKGANKDVMSDTTFTQTTLSGRTLYPLSINNRALLHGDIGVTNTSEPEKLPRSVQFDTGGISSLRGFRYNSIGPGRYLKELSLELQHRLRGDLYVAAFLDMGTADDNFRHSLSKSIGPALVYQSPFGSMSLNYAKAITKNGQPWHLEFNIGTTL